MAFEPDKITKEHVLNAVQKIQSKEIELSPSTGYDVIIEGNAFPPKEIMRYSHEQMNGEHIWNKSGGEPTNKFLSNLGFEIRSKPSKENLNIDHTSGRIWKLGCNWGSGKPSFYNYIKELNIVIGVTDKSYSIDDLVVITEGYQVKSIAKVLESPQPVTTNTDLQSDFEKNEIEYGDWITYAEVEWYELTTEEQFDYKLQQGICKVNDFKTRNKTLRLWDERNASFWIFQGNPNVFDFEKAIRENLLHDWTVSAHKDKIKVGDKVILWITGKNAGCYALGQISNSPRETKSSPDDHLWKLKGKDDLKAGIKIQANLIDSPLLWKNIKSVKGIENLKVGNQGTNFSATRQEYRIIEAFAENAMQSKYEHNNMKSKNIILYGPPGTGKTFTSIDHAIEIALGKSLGSHSQNKAEFDRLRSEGQIEFVTFHQSYTYEDFMVGIAPDTTSGILRFDKKDGIFKQLCERAKQNWSTATKKLDQTIDFDDVFYSFFSKLIEEEVKEVEIPMRSKGYNFKITAIDVENGRIKFTKQSGGTGHDLLVKNTKGIYDGTLDYSEQGLGVYYNSLVDKLKQHSKTLEPIQEEISLKNFILVIDEINRANISRVFGELITLLEDDKRLGEENELKITLPNGEKDFGIPPNLFIIGTMNTADKSIALIDIALRRRFEFIGYYPQYEGYNESAIHLLQSINNSIFDKKKSPDYLIGHAYFMKQQPIEAVLENKVIPLLLEYFSGKTDIVSNIFEGSGWIVSYDSQSYSWNISKVVE